MFLIDILTSVPQLLAAEPDSVVPTLLTGGGFAVLAAIVGGGFAWLNNRTTAAKSIAEGSREYVEGAREELKQAREDLKQARHEADVKGAELESARDEARSARDGMINAHRLLDDAQAAIRAGQTERTKLRRWIKDCCLANAEHKVWDDELQTELEGCGVYIRPAPPLMINPPTPGE